MDRHFLVVAADGRVRNAIADDLRSQGCTVTLAENASQAIQVVQGVTVQAVLIESHLPDMAGTELRDRLLSIRPDCQIAVLTSFNLVRNTPEMLRFGESDLLIRTDQVLDLLVRGGESEVSAGTWDNPATEAMIRVIDVLVGLLELEHRGFGSSSHVAMQLARATADELNLNEDMRWEVMLGTLLRDVGKTGVEADPTQDEIFSDGERHDFINDHVNSSLRLLEHIDFPWKVLPVIRHHHERYNGSGAPDGLRGREIPMAARIVAVVDAYSGLTAGKNADATNPDDALRMLAERTGHQFDPEVVEAFHRVIDKRLGGRRSRGKPLIVLVEPDAKFRRLLKVRLGNMGFKVREARDYEVCKGRLLKDPPDLALIGIDEDPTGAFQLLQELQQDDTLCRIPIAFVSARPDRATKIRALRMGVDDFLFRGDTMEELVARVESIVVRGAIRAEGDARRTRRGITGSLENLSLPDIVQTLAIGMKTACVTVTSHEQTGRIWFEAGTPKHAEWDSTVGEDAFYEMVRWEAGDFVIEHGSKSDTVSIQHDAMFLLMEGLRLIDEAGEEAHQAVS